MFNRIKKTELAATYLRYHPDAIAFAAETMCQFCQALNGSKDLYGYYTSVELLYPRPVPGTDLTLHGHACQTCSLRTKQAYALGITGKALENVLLAVGRIEPKHALASFDIPGRRLRVVA